MHGNIIQQHRSNIQQITSSVAPPHPTAISSPILPLYTVTIYLICYFLIQIIRRQICQYRNFYLALQKSMFQPLTFFLTTPTLPTNDIFEKYRSNTGVQHLPFRLYTSNQNPAIPAAKYSKNGPRGPYRRYSRQEKEEIIHRLLDGATLKRIAEETGIPKRNLIRWKHEFLHSKSIFSRKRSLSTEDCRSQSRIDREWVQTKESISQNENALFA